MFGWFGSSDKVTEKNKSFYRDAIKAMIVRVREEVPANLKTIEEKSHDPIAGRNAYEAAHTIGMETLITGHEKALLTLIDRENPAETTDVDKQIEEAEKILKSSINSILQEVQSLTNKHEAKVTGESLRRDLRMRTGVTADEKFWHQPRVKAVADFLAKKTTPYAKHAVLFLTASQELSPDYVIPRAIGATMAVLAEEYDSAHQVRHALRKKVTTERQLYHYGFRQLFCCCLRGKAERELFDDPFIDPAAKLKFD